MITEFKKGMRVQWEDHSKGVLSGEVIYAGTKRIHPVTGAVDEIFPWFKVAVDRQDGRVGHYSFSVEHNKHRFTEL